jgi:hypothetical protein
MFDVRPLLTRRRLLGLGLGAGVVAAAGAGGLAWDLLRQRPPGQGLQVLSEDEARVAVAVADAYFPHGNPFGRSAADVDIAGVLDAYMSELYPREKRGLRVLLRGLERWPQLALTGGPFSTLGLTDRQAVLVAFDESSIPERRLLGTVLRTVSCMALFEDARLLRGIGHQHGCGLPIYDDSDAGIG